MIYENQSNFTVQGLSVPLQFIGCSNFRVACCTISGFPQFGIIVQNCSWFWIEDNSIEAAASPLQNEAILLTGANTYGWICRNRLQGSGMDLAGSYITVSNNYVTGWQFGGGVTVELNASTSNFTISNNALTDGTGTDCNQTRCPGIETYAPYSVIVGNTCTRNAGCGITVGGASNIITGNLAAENGYAGISLYKGNGADASGSIVTGNIIDGDVNVYEGVSATIETNTVIPA